MRAFNQAARAMRVVSAALGLVALVASGGAHAQAKVAVADLSYKDTVQEYFSYEAGYAKSSERLSGSYSESDSGSRGRASYAGSAEAAYVKAEGTVTRIEIGELRKFTADIKGDLIKSGAFRVVQARPYTAKPTEQLFDVISRIKQGAFPGADYVLFGTVTSVEWRDDVQPLQGTRNSMLLYSLELGVDFSLINTRTHEVKAAFSVVGEGNDNKIWSGGARLTPNKARVMQAVSRSLAAEVSTQLSEQVRGFPAPREAGGEAREPAEATGAATAAKVRVFE